jgi:hypothetical protein
MDPLLILLCIVLVVPALYLLLSRRARRREDEDDLRADATERPELTGSVQRKERPYEHNV